MKNLVWISVCGVLMVHPCSVEAQQAPTEFIIKVKPADVDKIGKGLGKLPYEEVADLMQYLRQQVIEQQNKAVQEPKNAPSKP